MKERNPIRDAVKLALAGGVAASFAGAPAVLAQDDVAEQDKVTVTGTRISRVDIETVQPVTVISREDIENSGEISVAEVLRGSTYNSFGSFRQSSGSSAQSQSTVSLRGLGATRTLVLLDGRRMAGSPTFGAGSAQNLNIIPIAAVERIEILRDGASAVYGSDAIGGVVNIILRKDYEGVNLYAGMGRPTEEGGDEESFGITGGVTSGKGNITFTLDHEEQGIIFNGDRDFSDIGLSTFGFPGTALPFNATQSLGTFPDPRCPAGGTDENGGPAPDLNDPNFPASVFVGNRCRYNYAGVSANEASLSRDSFFVSTTYELSDDVNFFARGMFSKTDSFGRYAPTPQVGGSPFLPTMSAANPNNPTAPGAVDITASPLGAATFYGLGITAGATDLSQFDTDGDGVTDVTGPVDLSIWYRNVPGGFRDSLVEGTIIDGLVGLEGSNDWFGGSEWEVGLQHSKQTNKDTSKGLAIRSFLQQSIDSGAYDVFAVNGPTDPNVAQTFVHEGFHDEDTRIVVLDGSISFDAFQMDSGPVPVAVGFEYRDEDFNQNYDGLQNAGIVDGSAGGQDITGARAAYALYAETALPLIEGLELDVKARYDNYNDFGNAFTPQVGVSYRPFDSLLVRANYGEGFRAPSMSQLYSGAAQSFDAAVDTTRCAAEMAHDPSGAPNVDPATGVLNAAGTGANAPLGSACVLTQYQNFTGGNTSLDAEESTSFTAGAVWNIMEDLVVSLDYYNIEIEQGIGTLGLQGIFQDEYLNGGSSLVVRNANGSANRLLANNQNIAVIETDGLDLDVGYNFSAGNIGDFNARFLVSYVLNWKNAASATDEPQTPTASFLPDWRGVISLGWTRGDFGATLNGNHVDKTAFLNQAASLSSWTTWDLQVSYNTPWDGKVVVGARNVLNEGPPTDFGGLDNPFYSNQLHDIYGRVPYIRYEQDL